MTLRQLNEESEADCDLYVARNRYPSFLDYDYRGLKYVSFIQISSHLFPDISFKANFSVLVVGSGINLWKVFFFFIQLLRLKINYRLVSTVTLTVLIPSK